MAGKKEKLQWQKCFVDNSHKRNMIQADVKARLSQICCFNQDMQKSICEHARHPTLSGDSNKKPHWVPLTSAKT